MAADVRDELQSSKHPSQHVKTGIVSPEGITVLLIYLLRTSSLGQDRQEIVRIRGIAFNDSLHHRLHLYLNALLRLTAHLDQQVTPDVRLPQVCQIDKGKTPGTEAEDEDVAGKLQLVLHIVQAPSWLVITGR